MMRRLSRNLPGFCAVYVLVFGLLAPRPNTAFADTAWINPTSGLWSGATNWSFGLPSAMQSLTAIATLNTKTVTVDAAAPLASRTIQRLSLSAPGGSTNTLLVASGTLEAESSVTIQSGGRLVVSNALFRIDGGTNGSSWNIEAGEAFALSEGRIETFNVVSRIGRSGVGALHVAGGTNVLNQVLVGKFNRSQGYLTLSGGTLLVSSNLSLGDDVGSQGTVLMTGGELIATNDLENTRIGDDGAGLFVISNGVAKLDDVSVARHDTGTLLVAGGTMFTADLSIGRFPGATGVVHVVGGELLLPAEALHVGREGAGELIISNGVVRAGTLSIADATNTATGSFQMYGGTVQFSSNLVVGSSVSTGFVSLAGGELLGTNSQTNATLEVQQGSMVLNGATVRVEALLLTNVAGSFVFSGGSLESVSTTVANTAPFVVGDGTNAATLRLLAGTHTFADSLVISSNASLLLEEGATISGSVVNNGTVTTNSLVTAPEIKSFERAVSSVSVSFTTQAARTYTLQYKVRLTDEVWTDVATVPGTGGIVTTADPNPVEATRFYRVRTQ